jgi:hypothetical protein
MELPSLVIYEDFPCRIPERAFWEAQSCYIRIEGNILEETQSPSQGICEDGRD